MVADVSASYAIAAAILAAAIVFAWKEGAFDAGAGAPLPAPPGYGTPWEGTDRAPVRAHRVGAGHTTDGHHARVLGRMGGLGCHAACVQHRVMLFMMLKFCEQLLIVWGLVVSRFFTERKALWLQGVEAG